MSANRSPLSLPQAKLPTTPYNKIEFFAARGARSAPSAAPHTKLLKNPRVSYNSAAGEIFFLGFNSLSRFELFLNKSSFKKKTSIFLSVTNFYQKNSSIFFYRNMAFNHDFCLFEPRKWIKVFFNINCFLIIGAFLVIFVRKSKLSIF